MSPFRLRIRPHMLLIDFILLLAIYLVIKLQPDYSPQENNGPFPVPPKATNKQKVYIEKRRDLDVPKEYIARNDLHEAEVYRRMRTTTMIIDDDVNINRYSPISSAGMNGNPYYVLPSERHEEQALYHINNFNLMVSDRIPVTRKLRDMRSRECRKKTYNHRKLQNTSVIIVFHNEAWSTLIRTIHSVIKRSPRNKLREIILVDDASEREFLRKPLDKYVARLPVPVKVIRVLNRTGLIRARLLGAESAQGDILTFLDAHCECSKGWLDPLLARISQNRSNVVCPVIDVIDEDTFAYRPSFFWQIGAFKWDLSFRWYQLRPMERLRRKNSWLLPVRTPVMAGGIFAIDKLYFEEIGKYDDRMDGFGGENLELSFRIWQCGGSLEIIPCSRVGHVFRSSLPYSFPGSEDAYAVFNRNSARVASTWMDEWASFFFKFNPEAASAAKVIDVSSRLELRKRLKCKSFRWYLENVWPKHFLPMYGRFFGKIRNNESKKCLQVASSDSGKTQPTAKIKLTECGSTVDTSKLFILSGSGLVMSDDSACLDAPFETEDSSAVTVACFLTLTQLWDYDSDAKTFTHRTSGLCLDVNHPYFLEDVVLKRCDFSPYQEWILEEVDWFSPH